MDLENQFFKTPVSENLKNEAQKNNMQEHSHVWFCPGFYLITLLPLTTSELVSTSLSFPIYSRVIF